MGQNESGQRRTRYSDKEETVSKTALGQIDAEWKDIAGKIEMVARLSMRLTSRYGMMQTVKGKSFSQLDFKPLEDYIWWVSGGKHTNW